MTKKCKLLCGADGCTFPQRYIVAVLCACGTIVMCGQKDNMAAAIAVGIRQIRENGSSNSTFNATDSDINLEDIEWSDVTLQVAMFAFPVGFVPAQVPAGYLADLIGARWVYATGFASSTFLTIMMPLILDKAAHNTIFFARVLLGISQSVTYTCTSTLLAHWIPAEERSSVGGFVFGVYPLATIIQRVIAGNLRTDLNYWSLPLYFWAFFGVIWCCVYAMFVYSYPVNNPRMKRKEKHYLEGKVPQKAKLPVPWKMMKECAIWSLIFSQVSLRFSMRLLTGVLPWFLRLSPGLCKRDVNILVGASFFAAWVTSTVAGIVTDYGVTRRKWNLKWCRRVTMFVSTVTSSVYICLLYYFRNNTALAVAFFGSIGVFVGPYFSSYAVNHLDISLHSAGLLHGIIVCLGNLMAGIVLLSVKMAIGSGDFSKFWVIESWVSFCLCCTTGTLFLFTARAQRAEWDIGPEEQQKN